MSRLSKPPWSCCRLNEVACAAARSVRYGRRGRRIRARTARRLPMRRYWRSPPSGCSRARSSRPPPPRPRRITPAARSRTVMACMAVPLSGAGFEFECTGRSVSLGAAIRETRWPTRVQQRSGRHRRLTAPSSSARRVPPRVRLRAAAVLPPSYAHPMLKRGGGRFQSSSSGHGSPGRVVYGAELATGEGPKALFDAAVAELRAREC